MYYSDISKSIVTESEAHLQILKLLEQYYDLTCPKGNFEKYFVEHSNLISINCWNCFSNIYAEDNIKDIL